MVKISLQYYEACSKLVLVPIEEWEKVKVKDMN